MNTSRHYLQNTPDGVKVMTLPIDYNALQLIVAILVGYLVGAGTVLLAYLIFAASRRK